MSPAEIAAATGGTVTERAIAILVAAGVTSNRAIAEALGITARAVQKARKATQERTTVREPQFADANHSSPTRTPVRQKANHSSPSEPQFANHSSLSGVEPPACSNTTRGITESLRDTLSLKEERKNKTLLSGKPDVSEVDREFEDWYRAYPRREGRGQALRAYRAARKKTDAASLLSGVKQAQARYADRERRFVPLPATWLNGERWLDDAEKPANSRLPAGMSQREYDEIFPPEIYAGLQ